MFLEEMKTTDFEEGKKYVFVIPTGSTEQHGPFLPLGTDSYIQDAIINGVEKQLPELIFLPTMRITCSEEHKGFAGSAWISLDTMERVIHNICKSLEPHAKAFVLTTAHGGNIELLKKFVIKYKDDFPNAELHYIDPDNEEVNRKTVALIGGPVEDHAGNTEISIMLGIRKELTMIPAKDYPKKVLDNAFQTNRLKDFSEDGIADNHPEWLISKSNGEEIMKWIIEDFVDQLKNLSS
jgi:creatinine amidohydrolase